MGIYLSPGVFVREKDLSQIIPAVATSVSAIVGASNKGPSNQRILVTSDQQFLDLFGQPDPTVSFMHYAALAFLKDGNQLYVTRVHNGALHSGVVINNDTATSGSTALSVGEDDPTTFDFTSYPDGLFAVFAQNQGTWGNDISVEVTEVDTTENTFTINVYELQNGNKILVESWIVSRETKLDGYGRQLYLEDKINGSSNYIVVKDNVAVATSVLPKHAVSGETIGTGDGTTVNFTGNFANTPVQRSSVSITDGVETFTEVGTGELIGSAGGSGTINYQTGAFDITFAAAPANAQNITTDYFLAVDASFTGGSNGSAVTDGNIMSGWDLYSNPDDVDVRILINGGYTTVAVQTKMKDICESRKDCIAVLDLPSNKSKPTDAVNWRKNTQNFNSSYTALYGPDVKIYDQFNDLTLEVPPSGYVAGVYARTDFNTDPWYAPAGLRRGLLSVLGVGTKYTEGERDLLYPNGINPIRVIPGSGNVVWGQRTQQAAASALDRVNVRRLLIVLEKAISIALLNDVFELNTELTRLQVRQKIEEFLQRIQDRQGLQEFLVVVDESNNPPAVIDANQLNVDIFLKPVRAAEFVQLTAIITRSGANFEELIAAGALSA